MAANRSTAVQGMDANHLSVPEVEYELLARQVVPGRSDLLKRAQLKAVLSNEEKSAVKKLVQPGDFDSNVEQVRASIEELEKIVADDIRTPSLQECDIVGSRIIHLQGRLALMAKNATDKEKKDIVVGLSSDVLAVQGLMLSLTEVVREFVPELSSTVNSVAGPSCVTKVVPVYKWNVKFSGADNRESLMPFLEKVEDLREARGLTEQQLFKSAHDLFSGFALQWYRNIKSEVGSWEDLVKCLKRDFLPYEYELDLQIEIRNRTQGVNENVVVFIVAMESLYNRLDKRPSEKEIVRQIIRNLNPFFSQHLALQKIDSLSELRDTCRQIQEIKLKTEKYRPSPTRRSGLLEPDLACVTASGAATVSQTMAILGSAQTEEGCATLCWNCGKGDHRYGSCPEPRKVFCYGCGKPDVYKAQCPRCSSRRSMSHVSSRGNGVSGARMTSPSAETRFTARPGASSVTQSSRGRQH